MNIKKNELYYLIEHSLRTLRKHSNIDVVIYTDSPSAREYLDRFTNVQFIDFDSSAYRLEGETWRFSETVLHKWPNCADFLMKSNYDRVMFCDADIHFYKDPVIAFDIYCDPSKIYIKRETWNNDLIDGFNDGNFIIGREVAKKLSNGEYMKLYPAIREKMLCDYREREDFVQWWYDHLKWVSYQFASRYLFVEMGIDVEWVNKKHLGNLDDAPNQQWRDELVTDDLILVHFFSKNARQFVPRLKYVQKM